MPILRIDEIFKLVHVERRGEIGSKLRFSAFLVCGDDGAILFHADSIPDSRHHSSLAVLVHSVDDAVLIHHDGGADVGRLGVSGVGNAHVAEDGHNGCQAEDKNVSYAASFHGFHWFISPLKNLLYI